MKVKNPKRAGLTILILCLPGATLFAQGLLVDQASGTTDELIQQFARIPDNQIAQSFTPSLSAVGFVQFRTFVFNDNNGAGVLFAVNLREGAYNGPIIGSTTPVVMVNKLVPQIGTFYYPANIPVTPGQLYFFEPVPSSPGSMDIGDKFPSSYPLGDEWNNGVRSSGGDYWFREGIVVPEPSTILFLFLGGGVIVTLRRVGKRLWP